jgi:NitT/TauT family transport system substrate-binding protein
LKKDPDAVRRLLLGHLKATDAVAAGAPETKVAANAEIEALTGKPLNANVLEAAWNNLTFTVDPIPSSLRTSAAHAVSLKLLDPVDLKGIYDLSLLNAILRGAGKAEVKT